MDTLTNDVTKEQLFKDFKVVVADAEALLKATANQGDEKFAELRAKAEKSLKIAKAGIADAHADLLVKTKEAAKATDNYIHENPWRSLGVAASVGLVVGLLVGRR